jgi:predicted RNase H-like HicB family nuclease
MNQLTTAEILKRPYTILLRPDEEDDGAIVAHIKEFPGCTAHGYTHQEAIDNLFSVAKGWLEITIEQGLAVPDPEIAFWDWESQEKAVSPETAAENWKRIQDFLEIAKRNTHNFHAANNAVAELQQEHERLRKDSERLEFAMERLFIIDQRNKETFDRGGTVRIYDTRGALDAALGEKE